jgi:hypothetical protein
MKLSLAACAALLLVLIASPGGATMFVMPADDELVRKSSAIVTGTIQGSWVRDDGSMIDTIYELQVERAMKGAARRGELIRIVSPGGFLEERGVFVASAPRFAQGERVLLFLTLHNGEWHVTDLALGRFRFGMSRRGERVLVRDVDDVLAFDRNGGPHRERVRRESGFLRFIEDRVAGRAGIADYESEMTNGEIALPVVEGDEPLEEELPGPVDSAAASSWLPSTYTNNIADKQPASFYRGARWPTMSAGVRFYKLASQNIAGASDGGVTEIRAALASWTNECGSTANLVYGGTTGTLSQYHDGVNVIEFNDPQGRIPGSWGGSGTVGIAFTSYSGSHTAGGETWWNIVDSDIVFQNGYTASHSGFRTALTHEIGHSIGWRHSNSHHIKNPDGSENPCDPKVSECSNSAIMYSVAISSFGYALQPWDVNAVRGVYPGGTCTTCVAPSITTQPASVTISAGGSATLTVAASGTPPFAYQWYTGSSGNTGSPVSGATSASLTVSPLATTSYWVRVTNACGSASSTTATVTVTSLSLTGSGVRGDFNGDGRPDLLWRNYSTGSVNIWFLNGTQYVSGAGAGTVADRNWRIEGTGDFNGDRWPDIVWRNYSTGAVAVWMMRGATYLSSVTIGNVADSRWEIETVNDFNADGYDDLIWRHYGTGSVNVWFMRGTLQVGGAALYSVPDLNWRIEGSGDFNRDGRPDLLWRNYSTGAVNVWFLNGTTYLSGANLFSVTDRNWDIEAVGDYNGDARVDLIWRNYSTGAVNAWFLNATTYVAGANLFTVADPNWRIEGPR